MLIENQAKNIEPNIFLLQWKAWTWKSTLMNDLIKNYEDVNKPLVLASTWIAAVNIWGQTLHSFFSLWIEQLSISDALPSIKHEKVSVLVNVPFVIIDEVSMIHSNTLDVIDQQMRLAFSMYYNNDMFMYIPFAGKPILLVGDVFQLPPVTNDERYNKFKWEYDSEFFFDSDVIKLNDDMIFQTELNINYRQWADKHFWDLLDSIRDWTNWPEVIRELNLHKINNIVWSEEVVTLTTTNKTADIINKLRLSKIKWDTYLYDAKVSWDFPKNMYPHFWSLMFKVWAKVIMLNNDRDGRWVNWSMWYVVGVDSDNEIVNVKLDWVDTIYDITKHKRANTEKVSKQIVNEETWKTSSIIIDQEIGSYTQYPMKLAWAITIHKSQWQTFDWCRIDLERGAFATWQLYVALSRCRTLWWIQLIKDIKPKDVMVNQDALTFHLQMKEKSI